MRVGHASRGIGGAGAALVNRSLLALLRPVLRNGPDGTLRRSRHPLLPYAGCVGGAAGVAPHRPALLVANIGLHR
jgi:hypothetical protein